MSTLRYGLIALCSIAAVAGCGDDGATAGPDGATIDPDADVEDTDEPDGAPADGGGGGGPACDAGGPDQAPSTDGVTCTEVAAVTVPTESCTTPVIADPIESDLTLPEGCHRIDEHVRVRQTATVTIEPGAVVVFGGDGSLDFVGESSLQAVGTAAKPITFKGVAEMPGAWGGIRFAQSTAPAGGNRLEHVIIHNGGGFDWNTSDARNSNLAIQEAVGVELSNVVLQNSAGVGLFVGSSDASLTVDSLQMTGNESGAADVPATVMGAFPGSSAYGEDQPVHVRAGAITADQTWAACVPFQLDDDLVTIEGDALVTVAPGARVEAQNAAGISIVGGALEAVGEPTNAITFTGVDAAEGAWAGIRYASNTQSNDNVLENVIIEYGGGFDWNTSDAANANLNITDATVKLRVRNSVVQSSSGLGIYIDSPDADVGFDRLRFDGNAEGAASVPANEMGAFAGTSAHADGQDVIVRGGAVGDDQSWPACVPYRVRTLVEVRDGAAAQVEAGAVLRFEADGGIEVFGQGSLGAVGTEAAPVLFTGTTDTPGDWAGIRYSADSRSDENVLEHVVIEYGGGFDWNTSAAAPANLNVGASSVKLALRHATLRGSAGLGLYVDSPDAIIEDCTGVTIEDDPAVGGAFDTLDGACQ